MKENTKAPCHWPLWGDSPVPGEFPAQRASYRENVPFDDVIMIRSIPGCYLQQCWFSAKLNPSDKLLSTHWGQVMHMCISKVTIIGSGNGLLPGQCQAIIWTKAGILLIKHLRTNFNKKFLSKFIYFHSRKSIWKCRLENGGHIVSASMC